MSKRKSKIICLVIFLCISSLVACSKKDSKTYKLDVTSSSDDDYVKVAVVTNEKNEELNKTLDSYISNVDTTKESNDNIKYDIEKISFNVGDENSDKIKKIVEKKDLKVLVFLGADKSSVELAKKIRTKRNDIMLFSSGSSYDEKILSSVFDANFNVSYSDFAKNIVRNAKDIGSERFIYLSPSKVNEADKKNRDQIKEQCRELDIKFEEFIVEGNNKIEMQANSVNMVNSLLDKYSTNISIYPVDKNMNEVLLKMALKEKFNIPGFSNYNITKEAEKLYNINTIDIYRESYDTINAQISNFITSSYDAGGRIVTLSTSIEDCLLRYPCELGITTSSKRLDRKKLLNREYLEDVANFRTKLKINLYRENDEYKNNYTIKINNLTY